jgi:hypothetical protein
MDGQGAAGQKGSVKTLASTSAEAALQVLDSRVIYRAYRLARAGTG